MANVNVGTTTTVLDNGTAAAILVRNTGPKDVRISPGGYTLSPGSYQRIVTGGQAVTAVALRAGSQATVDVATEVPLTPMATQMAGLPTATRVKVTALPALPVGSTDVSVTWVTSMPSASYSVQATIEGGAAATGGVTAHPKTSTFTAAGCTITVVNRTAGAIASAAGFIHAFAISTGV